MGFQHTIGVCLLWITELPHIMLKEGSQLLAFGLCERQAICQAHLPLIQIVLVLGLRLNIGGVAIADVVEEVMGHLTERRKDLKSCSTCPLLVESLVLGVPAVVVAVISIVGTTSLSKVLQGNWTGIFQWLIGGVSWNIVPSDQVVALDLPLVSDVIQHHVAIFKVPSWR